MLLEKYSSRVDISSLHASFINANSKGRRYTARSLIGDRPILSDELESLILAEEAAAAFRKIFPDTKRDADEGLPFVEAEFSEGDSQ